MAAPSGKQGPNLDSSGFQGTMGMSWTLDSNSPLATESSPERDSAAGNQRRSTQPLNLEPSGPGAKPIAGTTTTALSTTLNHPETTQSPKDGSSSGTDDENDDPQGTPTKPSRGPYLKKNQGCLGCKHRKRRCDGKRPTCSTCAHLKIECVYQEVPRKHRTEQLNKKLEMLELRLAELQLGRAPAKAKVSANKPKAGAPEPAPSNDQAGPIAGSSWGHEWWLQDPPPEPIQKILLENCLSPHNPSAFELHAGRFRASMHQATSSLAASPLSPPAPALLNAMYLVGCFFSDDPSLWAAQSHYLTSTRKSLSDSLGDPKVSLVQWLQASCLLSYYLFRNSRLLEARQESTSAVTLTKSCGLHKIRSSKWQDHAASSHPLLPPPKDEIELDERISLFWQIYQFDNMSSLICGLAPDRTIESETETVWPQPFSDSEDANLRTGIDASVSSLFGSHPAHPFDPPCSMFALCSKAIALQTRVSVFAISCTPKYVRTPEFRVQFQEYQDALTAFLERLPPVGYDPRTARSDVVASCTPASSRLNMSVCSAHMVALSSFIQLCNAVDLDQDSFAPYHSYVYARRLEMAKRAMAVIRVYKTGDIPHHTIPLFASYFGFPVARVLAQHMRRLQLKDAPLQDELAQLRTDLDVLLDADAEEFKLYPVNHFQVERVTAYINGNDETISTHTPGPMCKAPSE